MKLLKTFILLFISILFIIFLLNRVDVSIIKQAWAESDLFFLLIAQFVFLSSIFFLALRWKLILSTIGYRLTLKNAIIIYIASIPFARVLPARLGDFIKSYYLKKELNAYKNSGGIFMEIALDMASLLILVFFGALIINNSLILKISIAGIILFILFFILIFRLGAYQKINKKYRERINDFFHVFKIFFKNKASIHSAVLSFFIWFIIILYAKLMFRAFGLNVPFFDIMIFQPIITLISFVPVTFSGIGTREAAMLYFYSGFGSASNILALTFIYSFFVAFLIPILSLPVSIYLLKKDNFFRR